jgi:hypothetical protein
VSQARPFRKRSNLEHGKSRAECGIGGAEKVPGEAGYRNVGKRPENMGIPIGKRVGVLLKRSLKAS